MDEKKIEEFKKLYVDGTETFTSIFKDLNEDEVTELYNNSMYDFIIYCLENNEILNTIIKLHVIEELYLW